MTTNTKTLLTTHTDCGRLCVLHTDEKGDVSYANMVITEQNANDDEWHEDSKPFTYNHAREISTNILGPCGDSNDVENLAQYMVQLADGADRIIITDSASSFLLDLSVF